jgi:hypothetical protein
VEKERNRKEKRREKKKIVRERKETTECNGY